MLKQILRTGIMITFIKNFKIETIIKQANDHVPDRLTNTRSLGVNYTII